MRRLALCVAVLLFVAGCSSASGESIDIEALVEERVEAALAEHDASSPTTAAVEPVRDVSLTTTTLVPSTTLPVPDDFDVAACTEATEAIRRMTDDSQIQVMTDLTVAAGRADFRDFRRHYRNAKTINEHLDDLWLDTLDVCPMDLLRDSGMLRANIDRSAAWNAVATQCAVQSDVLSIDDC